MKSKNLIKKASTKLVVSCTILGCNISSLFAQTASTPAVSAAAPPPPEQKVTVYGWVRNDIYGNTRKNADLRDGVLNVYPLDHSSPTDQKVSDANAVGQLGFSAIVTRLGVKFGGIKAFNADVSGILETDFFGVTTGTENLLRLRHAYANLDWTVGSSKLSLLLGQYWNPNFVAKCYPGTANFSTGIPFNPFGFVPQARVTLTTKSGFSAMFMAFGYDLAGFSPAGTFSVGTGVDAFKYAQMPALAVQVGFENKNILALLGVETIGLSPQIRDGSTNISQTFVAANFMALVKLTTKPLTVKLYGNYGDLFTQYVGLGGFVGYKDKDSTFKYSAAKQLNLWGDIILTIGKTVQPALFIGYMDNLGLSDAVDLTKIKTGSLAAYGRAITPQPTTTTPAPAPTRMYDNFVRIAPRVDFYSGKMKLSLEYEFSTMRWVTSDYDAASREFKLVANAKTPNAFDAENHRVIFVMTYNF